MKKRPLAAAPLVRHAISIAVILLFNAGCGEKKESSVKDSEADTIAASDFKADVDFLKKYTEIIVLQDASGKGKVAISPALQGRVMTSTSGGDNGPGYGWINREAFISGDTSEHMNAFGGEDRFWLGPEGGQYSIYFAQGKEFNLDNWHVPRLIDLDPFETGAVSDTEAVFTKEAQLTNYSGTVFTMAIKRTVKLIDNAEAWRRLGLDSIPHVSLVAYETINTVKNNGKTPWKKETGLLSIWILGMFNPSEQTTIIIPYKGNSTSLKEAVNDRYFGEVPADRLKFDSSVVYFSGDGKYRSKIGLSPKAAPEWLGSYSSDTDVLTLVNYSKPEGAKDYVNSLWEMQSNPYGGDVVNAYNDGPPSPGAKPLGPFYELETSSPAVPLLPGDSLTHVHTTFHIKGSPRALNPVMKKILGVNTAKAASVFMK